MEGEKEREEKIGSLLEGYIRWEVREEEWKGRIEKKRW